MSINFLCIPGWILSSGSSIKKIALAKGQGEAEIIINVQRATAQGLREVFLAMKESEVDDNIIEDMKEYINEGRR